MKWAQRLAAVLTPLAVIAGVVYGCSSDKPGAGGEGSNTTEGPCTDGTSRVCYGVLGVTDGIKSCFTGQQTCSGGVWSACQGPKGGEVEITSSPTNYPGTITPASAGGGGLGTRNHLPGSPDAGCNPCDPACNGFHDCTLANPVDAGDAAAADGAACTGISLDASLDPDAIAAFAGVPPGHVSKLTQDRDCWGSSYGHDCAHWPHQPGSGAPNQGYSACQADTRCSGASGCCVQYPDGGTQPAGHCIGALPDLTIGTGCTLVGLEYFPVCNRGNASVAAGTVIDISVNPAAGNLPQTTVYAAGDINANLTTPAPTQFVGCPNRTSTCQYTLGSNLDPGKCAVVTCGSISGTKHIYVNSLKADGGPPNVAECDLDNGALYAGSPVGPGCQNNWTVIGSPPPCVMPYQEKILVYPYAASCPVGTRVRWGKLAWNAVVPAGTNILFEVRSNGTLIDGGTTGWSPWVTAGDTPPDPAVCPLTGPLPCPKSLATILAGAAFNEQLEVRVTISPNAGGTLKPTLNTWNVNYQCVDSE